MKSIIELLNEKNEYLSRFYGLNEVELKNFRNGNFDNLDSFYRSRENIIEIIHYIDGQVEKKHKVFEEQSFSYEEKASLKYVFARKDHWVGEIMRQDLEILSHIDQKKSSIIRELSDVRRSRKGLSGYKSKLHSQKLDEEF